MTYFHFAYPWFKTLHFASLNFNPLPTSVKIRGKNVFYLQFYISLLKTKNNRKNSNKQDQRGGFCRETRCVSKQDQMDRPTQLVHHFSISLTSLSQSLISLSVSLIPSSHNPFQIFISQPFKQTPLSNQNLIHNPTQENPLENSPKPPKPKLGRDVESRGTTVEWWWLMIGDG